MQRVDLSAPVGGALRCFIWISLARGRAAPAPGAGLGNAAYCRQTGRHLGKSFAAVFEHFLADPATAIVRQEHRLRRAGAPGLATGRRRFRAQGRGRPIQPLAPPPALHRSVAGWPRRLILRRLGGNSQPAGAGPPPGASRGCSSRSRHSPITDAFMQLRRHRQLKHSRH